MTDNQIRIVIVDPDAARPRPGGPGSLPPPPPPDNRGEAASPAAGSLGAPPSPPVPPVPAPALPPPPRAQFEVAGTPIVETRRPGAEPISSARAKPGPDPGATVVMPAPAPAATPAYDPRVEAAGPPPARAAESEWIDVRKAIEEFGGEADKAFESIRTRMAEHLAAGGTASHWVDGKETPIARVEGGSSYAADGSPQGMMPLAAGLPGTKSGVELRSAPPPTPTPMLASAPTPRVEVASTPPLANPKDLSEPSPVPAPAPQSPSPRVEVAGTPPPDESQTTSHGGIDRAADAMLKAAEAMTRLADAKPRSTAGSSAPKEPKAKAEPKEPKGPKEPKKPKEPKEPKAKATATSESAAAIEKLTAANTQLRASLTDGSYLRHAKEMAAARKEEASLGAQAAKQQAVAEYGRAGAAGRTAAGVAATAARGAGQTAAVVGTAASTAAAGGNAAAMTAAINSASVGLSRLGPYGMAAAAGLQGVTTAATAFSGAVKAFADRGRELSAYSGATASASARAEVNQMRADIRESQVLGDRLAKMIEKQDQMDRTFRELMLPVKEFILDKMLQFMNSVIDFMKKVLEAIQKLGEFLRIDGLKDWANNVLSTLNRIAAGNEEPVDLLDSWLQAGQRFGAGPQGQPGGNMAPLFPEFQFGQFNP